ncbi:hypothetical protein GP486_004033 [Trichoglossum hirsutum]|uniref:PWWP domain-containing protein n=1 Tax=Trichoglossum hirsutum TaxID=265104 RepID=A0A9P8LBX4_9PEZI|nr:hypothetical protein GP486_004033 [Trichoglossum hirsutum]
MAEDSGASLSSPLQQASSPNARSSGAADDTKISNKAAGAHIDTADDITAAAEKIEETGAKKRNGDTNEHVEGKSDEATGEDVEMTGTANLDDSEKKAEKELETNAGRAKGATPRTNGAPGSNKKVKRKSVGVPEHKTKLNKKKSMAAMVDYDCQPGEYYFARMKGFPKWPCIISDDEMLPEQMVRSRPVTARRPDGTYREDYGPGGSKAHERSFPIMFLHTNEFAWMQNKDLEPLDLDTIGVAPEKGKGKSLIKAYQVAAERNDLQHFKTVIEEHNRAIAEDQERREAKGKGKGKAKPKDAHTEESDSEIPVDEVADEIEFDEDEIDGKTKGKSKKRKKDAESDEETSKPVKTPKRPKKAVPTTKLKLSTPKTPNGIASSKSATKSTSKTKATKSKTPSSKKSKVKVDEDEDMEDAGESPKVEQKPLSMEELRRRREKEILYFRHKLQKGFLTRDQMPKEHEMDSMADLITKLENFADLEGSIIRVTKIHKVLRAIIKLSSIPRDDEFHFKKRSHNLLAVWNKILASEPEPPTAASGTDKDGLSTNGVGKDGKVDEKDEEDGAKSASEDEKGADSEKLVEPVADVDGGASDADNSAAKPEDNAEQETENITS